MRVCIVQLSDCLHRAPQGTTDLYVTTLELVIGMANNRLSTLLHKSNCITPFFRRVMVATAKHKPQFL